ncbi:hypothetical protein D3C72_2105020 [compost metagenome]
MVQPASTSSAARLNGRKVIGLIKRRIGIFSLIVLTYTAVTLAQQRTPIQSKYVDPELRAGVCQEIHLKGMTA